MILLLVSTAFAQDPQIEEVPAGECKEAQVQSFLLPERHYDQCLKAAANLPVCTDALDKCTDTAVNALGEIVPKLDLILGQFDLDDTTTANVQKNIQELSQVNGDLLKENTKLRNQRNVLLAVGGTLAVVTAGTLVVVAL